MGFSQREGATDWLGTWYAALPAPASECVECGICEERCPFGVEATARMQQAVVLIEAA